jgi:hypothetical protein
MRIAASGVRGLASFHNASPPAEWFIIELELELSRVPHAWAPRRCCGYHKRAMSTHYVVPMEMLTGRCPGGSELPWRRLLLPA